MEKLLPINTGLKQKMVIINGLEILNLFLKEIIHGEVKQLIGITLDIHKEETVAQELQQSQQELLNAQEIAQLGSFTWNLIFTFSCFRRNKKNS
jgi:hypothetical protein